MLCDAIKYAYRQSKDGFVISFVVHPQDMPEALANADIGSQWQLTLIPLDEDGNPETAKEDKVSEPLDRSAPSEAGQPAAPLAPLGARSASYTKIAAIRCGEPAFWRFLGEKYGYPEIDGKDDAAIAVRELCGVTSRKDLVFGTPAGSKWVRIDTAFDVWRRYPELTDAR